MMLVTTLKLGQQLFDTLHKQIEACSV